MEDADFTRSDVGYLTGISPPQVTRMLTGRTTGTLAGWQRILDVLGIDVLDLTAEPSAEHAPRKRPGPFKCQVDGCLSTPLRHRASLWTHVKLMHGLRMAEYVEAHGEPAPLTTEEVEAASQVEIHCEITGCDQVYSTALGHRWPQSAYITHLRSTHGLVRDAEVSS